MSDSPKPFILAVSCGHGGRHSKACARGGKCSACGTKAAEATLGVEADYVRRLGDDLIALATSPFVRPIALNGPGEAAPHSLRASRAAQNDAGLILEIHLNESSSDRTHGAHMFHRPEDQVGGHFARAMAEAWPQGLRRQLLPSYRGDAYTAGMVEPANPKYWPRVCKVLDAYGSTSIPTVLAEVGYASNESDLSILVDPWAQSEMLAAMLRAVLATARVARKQ